MSTPKLLLIQWRQHHHYRPLQNLLLKRRYSDRSASPIALEDIYPLYRRCNVTSRLETFQQITKVLIKIFLVLLRCHITTPNAPSFRVLLYASRIRHSTSHLRLSLGKVRRPLRYYAVLRLPNTFPSRFDAFVNGTIGHPLYSYLLHICRKGGYVKACS
jgi:hypothetical protein